MKRICLILSVIGLLQSCISPVEGCLDTSATNYNVMADQNCCCTYPSLQLNLQYQAGNAPFSPSTIYTDAAGNEYRITRIAFYLSEIGLVKDGNHFIAKDSIWLYRGTMGQTDSVLTQKNVRLVNRTGFNISAGTFIETGEFTHLRFRFGLPEEMNNNKYSLYRRGHPLAIQIDSMHTFDMNEGYLFFKIETEQVVNGQRRKHILFGNNNSILIDLPYLYNPKSGEDSKIPLIIDVTSFLEGVDVVQNSDEEISLKLRENITKALKI
jgi:hypothetical protein